MEFELQSVFSLPEIPVKDWRNEILETNADSSAYGLVLSAEDAKMLAEVGRQTLAVQERIEIGKSATISLIERFQSSTYLSQSTYAETLAALLEVFYQVKEESLDLLQDQELIDIMFDFFEGESGGSVELLQGRDLDLLCRNIRNAAFGIPDPDEETEMEEPDA